MERGRTRKRQRSPAYEAEDYELFIVDLYKNSTSLEKTMLRREFPRLFLPDAPPPPPPVQSLESLMEVLGIPPDPPMFR